MNSSSFITGPVFPGIVLTASVGAGIIGGVFFAFSAFVMKALAQLPASQGVLAMQRINVVVLNPLFLGVFAGSAVLSLVCAWASLTGYSSAGSCWLLASGLLYLFGTFGVTVAFNVPLNHALARQDAASMQAAQYWTIYLRKWSVFNHIRTIASIASACCSARFLAL